MKELGPIIQILLVEDDLIDRKAVERALREMIQVGTYNLRVCSSVQTARECLAQDDYDVIISDYRLADGSVEEVMDAAVDIPLIVLTGAGDAETAVALMKAGAYDYLIKDINNRHLQELPMTLEQVLTRKRLETLAQDQVKELAMLHERQRIARDLHDSVTQTLFSSSMIADALLKLWQRDPSAIGDELRELQALSRKALTEMRSLLLELRPEELITNDLGTLLRQLVETVSRQTKLIIQLQMDVEDASPLQPDVKIAFYRIAQESLNNAVKHARAQEIIVSLRRTRGTITLSVKDDGQGFGFAETDYRHGLRIMRERAQANQIAIEIESSPDVGTRVIADWSSHGALSTSGR